MTGERGFAEAEVRGKWFYAMSASETGFSGPRESAWSPKATPGVATGPQRDAPKLSDSPLNDPLWVNDPFRIAARKQPLRTMDQCPEADKRRLSSSLALQRYFASSASAQLREPDALLVQLPEPALAVGLGGALPLLLPVVDLARGPPEPVAAGLGGVGRVNLRVDGGTHLRDAPPAVFPPGAASPPHRGRAVTPC